MGGTMDVLGPGMGTRGAVLEGGNWAGECSLDFRGDEVDLFAALVRHDRIVSGPRIRAQDDPVLGGGEDPLVQCPPPIPGRSSECYNPNALLTRNTRPAMVVPVLRA